MTVPSHHPSPIRRLVVVALCCLAIPAAAMPVAAADSGSPPHDKGVTVAGRATDPDDTPGRLDIAAVRDRVVQIDRHHYVVSYRVRVLNPFASARLDVDDRSFVLELNRDTEAGSERNVRVAARDGVLVAEVISNATREVVATVDVTRPGEQSIQISGPRRLLGARSYFWTSNFHAARSAACGYADGFPVVCQDSVPQRGWLRLQSPGWPDLG